MRPKKPETTRSGDLFRARLDQIINLTHELAQLAGKIDWDWIDGEIARSTATGAGPGFRPGLQSACYCSSRFTGCPTKAVSVALRPLLLPLDAYFHRSLSRRGFQIPDNALTAASSAFRSMTLESNRSGPQRRICSCSGCAGSLMASRYSA